MYLLHDGKICVMYLYEDMLKKYGLIDGDTSDLLYYGTSQGSVEVTLLFKEKGDMTKVSLRSKDVVDVRKVAEKFGGGGHMRAAGLSVNKGMEEAKMAVIKAVEEELI